MIGRIQGRLVEVVDSLALVDASGVAYEIELTDGARASLGLAGTDVTVFTHLVIREDAHLLFGFANRQERDVFRLLIRLNGVGPKLAMALLSSLSVGDLAGAVAAGDLVRLTRVPGVGKRTAERLVVELKDKLDGVLPSGDVQSSPSIYRKSRDGQREALAALLALGYRLPEAERALATVPEHVDDAEAIIRQALRQFVKDGGAN